jgi:hypothetical protein
MTFPSINLVKKIVPSDTWSSDMQLQYIYKITLRGPRRVFFRSRLPDDARIDVGDERLDEADVK